MNKLPDTLKDYNVYVDGLGYAGRVGPSKVGDLKLLTEDFIAGGMGGKTKIDMGALEEIAVEVTIYGTDAQLSKLFATRDKDIIFRGAYGAHANTIASSLTTRGLNHTLGGFADFDRSNKGEIKIVSTAEYLKWTLDNDLQIEYSVIPPILDFGEGNLFAAQNAAIGL